VARGATGGRCVRGTGAVTPSRTHPGAVPAQMGASDGRTTAEPDVTRWPVAGNVCRGVAAVKR